MGRGVEPALCAPLQHRPSPIGSIDLPMPQKTHPALVLQFAQAIDQPVSNLYYPCGLPFLEIGDYEVRYTLSG